MLMYEKHAEIYDLINNDVPYEMEGRMLTKLLEKSSNKALLDVACGTGKLISLIDANRYNVVGMDCSKGMLKIAQSRNTEKKQFVQGDMRNFMLNSKFGVVSCLGSAVQYNLQLNELEQTINNLVTHSTEYVLFDVRYCMDRWIDGYVKKKWYENEKYKVYEHWKSCRVGVYSIWKPRFKILNKVTGEKCEYTDYHKIRLFSCKEIEQILTKFQLKYNIVDVELKKCNNIKNIQFYYLIKI